MKRRKQIIRLLYEVTNNRFLDYIYTLLKEFVKSERQDKYASASKQTIKTAAMKEKLAAVQGNVELRYQGQGLRS